jgi:nucleotide-binding universal stress UspA family protein
MDAPRRLAKKEWKVMSKKILYATDFSGNSAHTFEEALKLARLTGADLVIAHVLHFPPMVGSAFLPNGEENEAAMRKWCTHRLDQLAANARTAGISAEAVLREGAVVHAGILAIADELGALMIVLGTHGHTGLSNLVIGSVAARVITEAICPVVTVRSK